MKTQIIDKQGNLVTKYEIQEIAELHNKNHESIYALAVLFDCTKKQIIQILAL